MNSVDIMPPAWFCVWDRVRVRVRAGTTHA